MKQIVKALARRAGFEISRISECKSERDWNPDVTDSEWAIYCETRPFTMLSLAGVLANLRAIEHIVLNKISGDIVECGAWRGGSSMAMAAALLKLNETERTLWLYDTFQGMTEPTDADRDPSNVAAKDLLASAKRNDKLDRSLMLAFAPIEDVRKNMHSTGYPTDRIRFVPGPVEQTIPASLPDRIALLRLDTDWYESTRHELINLYPRLSPGGILIIDDYGQWQGARQAVDEYFAASKIFLHRADFTVRVAIKPED
jgi:O-methyltransferase